MAHDIAALDAELNTMIMTGKAMEAFEKFYAEDCVMQENLDPPRTGKAACRDYEIGFFSSIQEFKKGELHAAAVTGDRSYSEWTFACTFKDGSAIDNTQVAARTWKDGKVVHERFYYKPNFTPA
jgi:ketosteroid isomerase-like protein